MCGRFGLFSPLEVLQERFYFELKQEVEWKPRYNVAPSQPVLAVVQADGQRRGVFFRWGLVPFWAKDPKIGYKMINARAETIAEKPSYRHLIRRKRCLILADGFYEWKKTEKGKQPYLIRLKDGEPFAFAGLWDRWEKEGQEIDSCTLITTVPNELMKPIHDRMPVILPQEAEEIWLDPRMEDTDYLQSILVPYPAEKMQALPVSSLVNSPANDVPECIKPLEI
jgi:putative SOS response-associated peptidase YedK